MCTSAQHAAHCADWLALLRKKAQFSLHLSEYLSVLPHGKEMKVQVGGVLALHKMYAHAEELDGQPDVYGTLERCLRQTTSFESVPFDVVMREVMRFRLRK